MGQQYNIYILKHILNIMNEIEFKKKVEKCKNTLTYFLENNYILQQNTCVSYQFAQQLAQNRDHKNTDHYSAYLTIDDTLWPQLNEIAEQALIELAEQQKVFNGLAGKFYLHMKGTSLFDETPLKIDRTKTKYFLAVPVKDKKFG